MSTSTVTLEHAGVLLVWSAERPHTTATKLTATGLVLGRPLLESFGASHDERISRQHCRLLPDRRHVIVEDLASRNGTYANGQALVHRPVALTPPFVVRTGHSVWVVVADIRPYREIALARRGRLVVGATIAPVCREVDKAARAKRNLLLVGPRTVGRELAGSYAATIGAPVLRFDPELAPEPLERVLARHATGTVILELDRTLPRRDMPAIAAWVSGSRQRHLAIVTRLERWLAGWTELETFEARRLELPSLRFDELPTTVADLIRDVAPEARIHASAIERCLLEISVVDEDSLVVQLRDSLQRWRAGTETRTVRGGDLDIEDPDRLNHCIVDMPKLRRGRTRRARPRTLESAPDPDASWNHRRLCVDGACLGVIAPDGRCRVCGSPAPLGSPYR